MVPMPRSVAIHGVSVVLAFPSVQRQRASDPLEN